MKILVVCQYYFPEPFRISDICEALVEEGHEVTVVTGVPNYPEGKIYQEYIRGRKRHEVINGVKVHRCFTIGRRRGPIFRFLNYYSYSISSSLHTSFLNEKFDIVLVNQLSPVMMASAAIRYKNKHKTKLVLYCLDLWPESLVIGGIKRNSILYRLFRRVSRKIYGKADRILVSSQSFARYFRDEFGIEDTLYLPQYAEKIFEADKCKKTPDGKIDLMFAGNVGLAQSVETVLYAAQRTKDVENLRWHVVGDGSEMPRMQEIKQKLGLSNVIFHGRQPLERMPAYYSKADAMIVTMGKDETISLTLPGKMQTYMAAGKPILGAVDGEAASVIKESGCGLCCAAEDAEGLANIARCFVAESEKHQFGASALQYYKKMFSKEEVLQKMMDILEREVK